MADRERTGLFGALLPFLLSHHPMCSFFHNDTYRIFGREFCLGCSITYPSALLFFIIILLTRSYRSFPEPVFHQSILLLASMIFGSLQLVKYRSERRGLSFKILIKVLLGASMAGAAIWVLTIPAPVWIILLFLIAGLVLLSFIGSFRLMYVNRICSGCIYHGDWDICFGFRGLNRYHFFKHIRSERRIIDLIFDKKKKNSKWTRTGPQANFKDPEPELISDNSWILDENYVFPWIPKQSSSITSKEHLSH